MWCPSDTSHASSYAAFWDSLDAEDSVSPQVIRMCIPVLSFFMTLYLWNVMKVCDKGCGFEVLLFRWVPPLGDRWLPFAEFHQFVELCKRLMLSNRLGLYGAA